MAVDSGGIFEYEDANIAFKSQLSTISKELSQEEGVIFKNLEEQQHWQQQSSIEDAFFVVDDEEKSSSSADDDDITQYIASTSSAQLILFTKANGFQFVCKMITCGKEAEREATIMASLEHENILRFYGQQEQEGCLLILMEYAPEGSLYHVRNQGNMTAETAERYLREICEGVRYLHSQGIVHGDLKCENIMICYGCAKIGDFGESRSVYDLNQISKKNTFAFTAPEILKYEGLKTFQSDIWALGALAYQLVTGNAPFTQVGLEDQHVYQMVMNATALPILPPGTPSIFSHFLTECGKPAGERPNIDELIQRVFG